MSFIEEFVAPPEMPETKTILYRGGVLAFRIPFPLEGRVFGHGRRDVL
jgi:hypothetical protein